MHGMVQVLWRACSSLRCLVKMMFPVKDCGM